MCCSSLLTLLQYKGSKKTYVIISGSISEKQLLYFKLRIKNYNDCMIFNWNLITSMTYAFNKYDSQKTHPKSWPGRVTGKWHVWSPYCLNKISKYFHCLNCSYLSIFIRKRTCEACGVSLQNNIATYWTGTRNTVFLVVFSDPCERGLFYSYFFKSPFLYYCCRANIP